MKTLNKIYHAAVLISFAIGSYCIYKSLWPIATYLLLLAWYLDWRRVQLKNDVREQLAKYFDQSEQVMFTSDHIADIIRGNKGKYD